MRQRYHRNIAQLEGSLVSVTTSCVDGRFCRGRVPCMTEQTVRGGVNALQPSRVLQSPPRGCMGPKVQTKHISTANEAALGLFRRKKEVVANLGLELLFTPAPKLPLVSAARNSHFHMLHGGSNIHHLFHAVSRHVAASKRQIEHCPSRHHLCALLCGFSAAVAAQSQTNRFCNC